VSITVTGLERGTGLCPLFYARTRLMVLSNGWTQGRKDEGRFHGRRLPLQTKITGVITIPLQSPFSHANSATR
jgi:hypothetical protein